MPLTKKTLIIGATPNPSRFAFQAAHMLKDYGHEIIPFGIKKGEVAGETILNSWPENIEIDTVTLYISSKWQTAYYEKLIELNPKRIIFNPGTENTELEDMASEYGIECLRACTLVMLQTNQY